MGEHRWLLLATALLMFPQLVETIYSPALPDIGLAFGVSAEDAAQTLSIYFLGFALGVLCWGRACDIWGRRPAMLAGLSCYAAGVALALYVDHFGGLLLARLIAAFGAASGSVVTQTALRDRHHGAELMRVFAWIGAALALSPALGIVLGNGLLAHFGYRGVFVFLVLLAVGLLAWSTLAFSETRTLRSPPSPFWSTLQDMLKDPRIRWATLLVATFNATVFAYYSLAPFDFQRLGLAPELYGYSGILLAAGSLLGALLGRRLLAQGWPGARVLNLSVALVLLAGGALMLLRNSAWFALPMLLVMAAFALAIPPLLGSALVDYAERRGTAGAVLGLLYYMLLSLELALIGWSQNWTLSLLSCAALIWLGVRRYRRYL